MCGTKTTAESIALLEKIRGGKLTFGKMVWSMRRCEEWSLTDLSNRTGMRMIDIGTIETDQRLPEPEEARVLAEAFQMSPNRWERVVRERRREAVLAALPVADAFAWEFGHQFGAPATTSMRYSAQTEKWYFWNETWSVLYGPFDTRGQCADACNRYAEVI